MNPKDISKMQINGFNDRSFRTNAQNYISPNIVVVDVPTGQEMHGLDGFIQYSEGFVSAMPNIKGTILAQELNGNTVVSTIRGTGTFTGQLETPQGTVPGNGNKVELEYQLEVVVENDKIVRFTLNYDMQSLISQLG